MTSENQQKHDVINPVEENSDEWKLLLIDLNEDEEDDGNEKETPTKLKLDNNFEFDLVRGDIDSFVSTMDVAGSVVYENDQPYKYNFESVLEKARVVDHTDRCDIDMFQELVSIAFGTLYDELVERLGITSKDVDFKHIVSISETLQSEEVNLLIDIYYFCPRIPTVHHIFKCAKQSRRKQVLDGLVQIKQIFQNVNSHTFFETVAAAEREELESKTD